MENIYEVCLIFYIMFIRSVPLLHFDHFNSVVKSNGLLLTCHCLSSLFFYVSIITNIIQCLSSLWLIMLNMLPSNSTQIVVGLDFFLLKNSITLYTNIVHLLYPSICQHCARSWFYIVSSVTMNIDVQIYFQINVFLFFG